MCAYLRRFSVLYQAAVVVLLMTAWSALGETTIYYVDQSATSGSNNGTTGWANAYLDLQSALGNPSLVADDEIWVAQGTYKPTVNPDLNRVYENGSLGDGKCRILNGTCTTKCSGYCPAVAATCNGCTPSDSTLVTFLLVNGVKMYGGFPAGGATKNSRDPAQYETILSGDK